MAWVQQDRGPAWVVTVLHETLKRAANIIPLALVLGCLSACVSRRDPQVVFDSAERAFQKGNIAVAAKEADKGYVDFHSLSREWAWKFTILRAKTLHWEGLNEDALKLMISEPAPPASGELAVARLRMEAVANNSLGRARQAELRAGEAEQLCKAAVFPVCAEVVSVRGHIEMNRSHYAVAQALFNAVLASSRARGDQFLEANSLLDLSWSANEQTHFDEALDWADDAREISAARDFADIAQAALGNMGWAYYKLGDPEKAEGMFVEAKRQAEELGDVTDQVTWLQAVGYIYLDASELAFADESFRQSLRLSRQVSSREHIINALIALAFISERTGKLDDAKRYAEEALSRAREDNNGRDQVYPQLVQGRVAARLHDATTAESAFREVSQSPDSPVFLKWEAERSLARLFEHESQFDSADREYRTALATFETARSQLKHEDSRLPFLTNASRIYDDYIHFLVARGKTTEALQVADFGRARTLSEGLGLLPTGSSFSPLLLNAQKIAQRAGGTILFYWLGEEQSYLWAITPQKIGLFQLPPAAEIKARVERYRKAIIEQRESSQTANDDGVALYRVLVEPAKDLLPNDLAQDLSKNGQVFIVPDGSLNSLNFETLLVPDLKQHDPKQHYWIEDVTLSSASSLRMLQAFHAAHSKGAGNLLLFGDAIAPNDDFPPLPKAEVEMESIEKHFPPGQQQVFSREQASPPAYLASGPQRFSYIHFVAHGTASRLSPLDSAIVLSKASAEDDSFKLYARDIIRHPLRAELVTVSTCRSAGARAYSGEGLVGLSWAFVRAGAHNVIGALWDVSDASTPQLIDELYGELKKGKTPDAALRDAKLTLLRSGASFRKPFYWAPFQLYTGS
jgi:CHAT domain-containing protein